MVGIVENLNNLFSAYSSSNKLLNATEKELMSKFSDLKFGASFNPEHGEIYNNHQDPLEVLKYTVETLKIKDIRLAFRWSMVNNKEFSFDYYKRFLDYCVENNVSLTLNLGPIKTMRWPEEHIPESLTQLVDFKQTIDLQHPIGQHALNYLDELCKYLLNNYSNHLNKFGVIQCNNEFQNRFGVYRFLIEKDFEVACISIVKKYFPNSKILLNSNGLLDVNKIIEITEEFPNTRFTVGINYYYKVGGQNKFPIINKFDGLFLSKIPYITPKLLRKLSAHNNYEIEVSELQGEPWLPDAPTPGNSFKEFLFELHRIQLLKPIKQEYLLARYWGIEDIVSKVLSGKATEANRLILNLIQAINSRKGLTR